MKTLKKFIIILLLMTFFAACGELFGKRAYDEIPSEYKSVSIKILEP